MAKILVVEDDKNNMRLITKLLDQEGHKIVKAETGEDGVKLAMEDPPDIILMDIKMPVMSGDVATKIIKESRKDLPVIALTAYATSPEVKRYMQIGFDAYITKPIMKNELLRIINENI